MSDSITGLLPGAYTVTVTDLQGCTATQSLRVKYLSDSQNPGERAVLRLYPNPATSFTYVEMPETTQTPAALEVFDALGRRVRVFELEVALASNVWQVSLAGFPAGTYPVRLLDARGRVLGVGKLVR